MTAAMLGVTRAQPLLVPAARARLELASWVDPLALEGLEGYSHCWVFYLFHANTDGLCMLDAAQGAPQQVPMLLPRHISMCPPCLSMRGDAALERGWLSRVELRGKRKKNVAKKSRRAERREKGFQKLT